MDLDIDPGIATGMTVFGADRRKIGKVVEVHQDYIVVEKGFFFPADHFIPIAAIARMGEDKLYLSVTKDDALHQGWDQQPRATDARYAAAETTWAELDGSYAESARGGESPVGQVPVERLARGDSETIRVPVYEEELTPVTREVDRGAILIEKELVTEYRTITVPVTEERVTVTRVPPGTPGSIGADAFENGAIEIPIRGQEIDVERAVRLTGEVVVEKETVQGTQRVGGTVRREEVRVDDRVISDLPDIDESATRSVEPTLPTNRRRKA